MRTPIRQENEQLRTQGLSPEEWRVIREALGSLIIRHQLVLRQLWDGSSLPFRQEVERDLEIARRLLGERFPPAETCANPPAPARR